MEILTQKKFSTKRIITSIFLAWLLFIGVDFLFHASILSSLWNQDIAAIKSQENLAILIPSGYLSFLLLTFLIVYVFTKIFKEKPAFLQVLKFGLTFGILFGLSNLLGWYSFLEIPLKQLIAFNFVYFIEILAVTVSIYSTLYSQKLNGTIWYSILFFIVLILLGIIIQNIF